MLDFKYVRSITIFLEKLGGISPWNNIGFYKFPNLSVDVYRSTVCCALLR